MTNNDGKIRNEICNEINVTELCSGSSGFPVSAIMSNEQNFKVEEVEGVEFGTTSLSILS